MTERSSAIIEKAEHSFDESIVRSVEWGTDAWVVLLSETEHPPRGCASIVDWRLHGAVSRCLVNGIFSGRAGECAYLPDTTRTPTRHFLFVGMGPTASTSEAPAIPSASIKALESNLRGLRLRRVVVSRREFAEKNLQVIARNLVDGGQLWTTE